MSMRESSYAYESLRAHAIITITILPADATRLAGLRLQATKLTQAKDNVISSFLGFFPFPLFCRSGQNSAEIGKTFSLLRKITHMCTRPRKKTIYHSAICVVPRPPLFPVRLIRFPEKGGEIFLHLPFFQLVSWFPPPPPIMQKRPGEKNWRKGGGGRGKPRCASGLLTLCPKKMPFRNILRLCWSNRREIRQFLASFKEEKSDKIWGWVNLPILPLREAGMEGVWPHFWPLLYFFSGEG